MKKKLRCAQNGRNAAEKKRGAGLRVLRRLLSFAGGSGWLLIAGFVLALVFSLLSHMIPVKIADAIDLAAGEGNVDTPAILGILASLPLLIGISALSDLLLRFVGTRCGTAIVKKMRASAFGKLQRLPVSYIDGHSRGDIISRVITDSDRLSDGLLTGIVSIYSSVLGIAVTLVFMAVIDPVVAAVVVVLTPFSMLVASFISGRTFKLFKKSAALAADGTSVIEESVSGKLEVKLFGKEDDRYEKFAKINEEYRKTASSAVFFSSLTNPVTRFVNSIVYVGVALTAGLMTASGRLGVAGLTVLLTFSREYAKPFNDLSGVLAEAQNALASAERIFEFLDAPEEPVEPAGIPAVTDGDRKGRVEAEKVAFSYTGRPFMEDISFSAGRGMKVAIVGPTGCGKTTLVNLFMRFYSPSSGDIRVGDKSILRSSVESVRASFGMVLQDTWLSSGTVRENLTLGRSGVTDEEIREACRLAHADSFIGRLPLGYDTPLGDSGALLSAGERQLLCIARVMICPPPLLILDEATSSIDTMTEMRIQDAFSKLMKGRTSFIVAHRLGTIKNADLILVMNDGHIIEQGTHDALMSSRGFYFDLYSAQFKGLESMA